MVYYTIMKKIVLFTLIAVLSIALVVAARHYIYSSDSTPYSSTDKSGFTNGQSGAGGGGGGGGSQAK
jgi:uncharacterized membrane protein YgcG